MLPADEPQRQRSAKIETPRSRSIPSHLVGVHLARNISGKGPVLGSARDSRRVQKGPCLIRRLKELNRRVMVDLEGCWGEFKVTERHLTMGDLTAALKENRVKEMFGAGTACIVCPVGSILYKGDNLHIPTVDNGQKLTARILKQLTDIQLHSAGDRIIPVDMDEVALCNEEYVSKGQYPCDQTIFELCCLLMEQNGWDAPEDPFAAAELYSLLRNEILQNL
ncbi:UNVERIFIED_CONTAM: hypothetical protein FKN15_023613 [Acipenser sinensis]